MGKHRAPGCKKKNLGTMSKYLAFGTEVTKLVAALVGLAKAVIDALMG